MIYDYIRKDRQKERRDKSDGYYVKYSREFSSVQWGK